MSLIHPTAIIAAGAELGPEVQVGPYCTVGARVRLGAGTRLISHVVLDGDTELGPDCIVFPFASVGMQTQDLKFKGALTCTRIGGATTIRECVTIHAATSEGGVTRVGEHGHIMAYAHVAHDCCIGNHVILSNGAQVAGHCVVGDRAIVSAMTGVHQFGRVGTLSFIGAYCKVTQDVPPYMLVDGTPARVPSINAVGLKRAGLSEEVQRALKQAHRLLYRQELSTSDALREIETTLPPLDELRNLVTFIRASERGIVK